MIFFNKKINKLRKISFYLFLIPSIALVVSLLLHNILVSFKFSSSTNNYYDKFPIIIDCNESNSFCHSDFKKLFNKTTRFDECETHHLYDYILVDDKRYITDDYVVKYLENKDYSQTDLENLNIKLIYKRTNKKSHHCIKNSKLFKIYKLFPSIFYFVENIKNNKKYIAGTSTTVNPFIYGETSISNIVKRYPVDAVFKPLMYISSLLMILYWFNYHSIFKRINESKKIQKFTIFGVASSLFLLFHVIFLGTSIDNEIFNKIRKLILVLFILCEILAQFFLTRRLHLSLDKIEIYIYKKILNLKIVFVSIIVLSSIIILSILSFFNLDSKVDYILEWNYFFFLLLFYFLSSIMWKKIKII